MWFSRTYSYSGVPSDEGKALTKSVSNNSRKRFIQNLILVLGCFFAGAMGFLVTSKVENHSLVSSHGLRLEIIPHSFRYNASFSYPPSNHTNQAWRDLFPLDGGFFTNPIIAPTRSTFSVFHQLHCLNGLRGAYWANHNAALKGEQIKDDDLPMDLQEFHIRHCIDLLRQALMCHGDTTLEVVDEAVNGVHGFRVMHQCRNWKQLKDWTSEQQARDIAEKHAQTAPTSLGFMPPSVA